MANSGMDITINLHIMEIYALQGHVYGNLQSLFTNVPVDESVQVIHRMLQEDSTLEERSDMGADRIADLLAVCLRSTYFLYNEKVYKQNEGALEQASSSQWSARRTGP